MSLTIESVNLIRKTDIDEGDVLAFLKDAVRIATGSDPGDPEWSRVQRMERGRAKGVEYTITEGWQPGLVDVRRVRVENYDEGENGKELTSARITYTVRNLPDNGSLEFKIDNSRLKGASLEAYAEKEVAQEVGALFRQKFTEA